MKKRELLEGNDYIVRKMTDLYGPSCVADNKQWIVISYYSEQELVELFDTELKEYYPWIYLTVDQYSVIIESERNDNKYKARGRKIYSYSSESNDIGNTLISVEAKIPSLDIGWGFLSNLSGFDQLSYQQKRRLYLCAYAGYTVREIAALEGISFGAVAQSINRAKRTLSRVLKEKNVSEKKNPIGAGVSF